MPNNPSSIFQLLCFAGVAVAAGALDYLHGVRTGRHTWSILLFLLHLCLSLFTGALAVMAVTGMGYDAGVGGAAAGVAGFMNVRIFEILESKMREAKILPDRRRAGEE